MQKIFWGDGIHGRVRDEFLANGQYKGLPVGDRSLEKAVTIKLMIKMRGSRRRNCLGKKDGAKLKKRSAKVKPFLAEKYPYFPANII